MLYQEVLTAAWWAEGILDMIAEHYSAPSEIQLDTGASNIMWNGLDAVDFIFK